MTTHNTQVSVIQQVIHQDGANISAALPSHIKPEKFGQVMMTAGLLNPDLEQCTYPSLYKSFLQCAKDGLVPDNKEAAIVIYNKKQGANWVKEAQYQPMIDGILKRLRMSGEVPYVSAKVVYQEDTFDYYMDMNGENLIYRPSYESQNRSKEDIKVFFAMAKLRTGEAIVEVMTREEVEKIMYLSKSAIDKKTGELNPNSVWAKFFDRMGLKTVLHRLSKRLPNSSEVMEMIERDVDIKKLEKGVFVEEQTPVATISLERINELKQLATSSGSNESQMFAFISSKSGRVVNNYEDLQESEADTLQGLIEDKIRKQVDKERQQQMSEQNDAPMSQDSIQGELMPQA